MDIDDILRQVLSDNKKSDNNFPSRDACEDAFRKYDNLKTDFQVGDLVVRNEMGLKRYNYPSGSGVARVECLIEKPTVSSGNDSDMNDMVILVAGPNGSIAKLAVDRAFYKLADDKSNVSIFKRKKDK